MTKIALFQMTSDVPPYRWEGRTISGRPIAAVFMHTQIRYALGPIFGRIKKVRRKLDERPTMFRPSGPFNPADIRKHLKTVGIY